MYIQDWHSLLESEEWEFKNLNSSPSTNEGILK